uniref:Cytochrome P450 monooxygenase CYP52X1 n=1 Tax=Ganoderma boninense TaxID=34458 RepID=A0A5K1K7G5_9APHY|nr:Cytochrome P450 monooxygenase CYP52X1 [Ganoderma boninense]
MLMDILQSGIQGTDLKDPQPKVEGTFTEELWAKDLRGPPKTWRRWTFVVKAVQEGDVDLRQEIQTTLVLGDEYRCLPGLAPAPSLPSPPGAQAVKCDAPPATCHRVVTTPAVGRPIWEYRSDKELLTGLLYVLESHQRLCSRGWLHGDISANNIFLAIDEEHAKHAPGFMIDWDAGYAPPDVTDPGTKVAMQELPGCGGPVQEPVPSAAATGIVTGNLAFKSRQFPSMVTLQFMSRRQLTQVLDPSSNIQPTPGDDVESFFLVLVYAIISSLACSDRMLYVKSRDKDNQLDFEIIRWRRQQLLDF